MLYVLSQVFWIRTYVAAAWRLWRVFRIQILLAEVWSTCLNPEARCTTSATRLPNMDLLCLMSATGLLHSDGSRQTSSNVPRCSTFVARIWIQKLFVGRLGYVFWIRILAAWSLCHVSEPRSSLHDIWDTSSYYWCSSHDDCRNSSKLGPSLPDIIRGCRFHLKLYILLFGSWLQRYHRSAILPTSSKTTSIAQCIRHQ